jgi:uncharacterized protein (TIGR02611 family)
MNKILKIVKKASVAIVGFTVIIIGCALLILPGPGILVILAGIAILALEFEWAQRHLEKSKQALTKAKTKVKKN